MVFALNESILHIVISTIVIGLVLWLSGRVIVGKQRASLSHGLLIAALGIIIGAVLQYFSISGTIALIVMVIVWLALIKHFFKCGWLKALLVAIVAIIIFIIVAFVLLLMGFAAFRSYIPITYP